MDDTPNLNLPFIAPQQAQKHVTHNEAIRALDALVQLAVIDRVRTSPPAAPTEGERRIVAAPATGAFAGHENEIAAFQDGAFAFFAPRPGWLAWCLEEEALLAFDGAGWRDGAVASVNPAPLLGVNATADAANRLAVKSPASLFDHDGADHRLKINKAAPGATASLLFQTGYAGRAEIGLAGDDNLGVKVSPDGAAFQAAIVVDKASAFVGFGAPAPASRLHVAQASDARLTIETTNPGSGGGFDIKNAADNQSWRVTGQADLFKLRDHTAGLDKLVIKPGSAGDAWLQNVRNFGVGTTAPTVALHVAGPARVGSYAKAALPSAAVCGAGAIVYVADEIGGATIAFSDGLVWRRVADRASVA